MMKTTLKIFISCAIFMLFVLPVDSDDKELFMGLDALNLSKVKPNVVILMDSSGSMNNIITYPRSPQDVNVALPTPGYLAATDYPGTVENAPGYLSSSRWLCRWINGNTAEEYDRSISVVSKTDEDTFRLNTWEDGDYNSYLEVDDWVHDGDNNGYAQIASRDGSGNVTLKNRVGTFTGTRFRIHTNDSLVFRAAYLYGNDEANDPIYDYNPPAGNFLVRYPYNYLVWLFLHATDAHREAVSYFSTTGNFLVGGDPVTGTTECECSDINVVKRLFTRIQVAREVICKVFASSNKIANLGLYKFQAPSSGAELLEGLTDASDENTLNQLKKRTYLTVADAWTPLSEALADIWRDMKPQANNITYWPADYEINTLHLTHNFNVPNSPIKWYCQKNFVVIMTDGESTQDQFDDAKYTTDPQYSADTYGTIFTEKPIKRPATGWASWDDGWGDTDENEAGAGHIPADYDPDDPPNDYCPNYTCWLTGSSGSDYLDDVAYFLANQDMFPSGPGMFSDDPNDEYGFPEDQVINTYTIGFNMDNDLLEETAINGGGEYYTADDYNQLVAAFQKVFDSIKVRSYAFASITAPRRSTSASSESISYIGFFIPSGSLPIWDGYLWAYKLLDTWGFDDDSNGVIDKSGDPTINEYIYTSLEECQAASGGKTCARWLRLSASREYDAAAVLRDQGARNLWTYLHSTWWFDTDGEGDYDESELYATQAACEAANPGESCTEVPEGKYYEFTTANEPELRSHLAVATATEGERIINKIRENHLADIYHSDVNFIGSPPLGKKYQPKINPLDPDGEQYIDFADDYKDRTRVLTVGTNDGVFHLFDANEDPAAGGGRELYGFIPDVALPRLRNMVIGDGTLPAAHTYTVDGRTSTESIYFIHGTDSHPSWSTMLAFGLRDGGRSFYALDVTESSTASSKPSVMWKFKDDTYSGNSWAKPLFGKVYIENSSGVVVDKHVIVLAGGMAYNHEISTDLKGKAVFVVDASTGELIWMVGYNPAGAVDVSGTPELETMNIAGDNTRFLTQDDSFNFPVPSSLTTLDRDNDGLMDTFYFGNLGGNLFKVDCSAKDPADWKLYLLYQSTVTTTTGRVIDGITDNNFDIGNSAGDHAVGQLIMGATSKAFGYIKAMEKLPPWTLAVETLSGTFQVGETLLIKQYDSIFLSPAVARDDCNKIWVTFGTGDRDRPRSNPDKGRFVAFLDSGNTNLTSSELQELTWTDDEIDELPTGTTIDKGWYFHFPDNAEKMFDPEPYILPDDYMTAHIHFNTFQPPDTGASTSSNPCSITEGGMTRYDVTIENCLPIIIDGERDTGRIAGGGMYEGGEYVTYTSETGMVADVPVKDEDSGELLYKTTSQKFPYPGGLIFLREITR